MLKIFIQTSSMGLQVDEELKMYRLMEKSPKGHTGRKAVRTLIRFISMDLKINTSALCTPHYLRAFWRSYVATRWRGCLR